jgi:hypothetical protein
MDIKPTAEGVGVIGGNGLAFFRFGVAGLPLDNGSVISGAVFLFLLMFATLGGASFSVDFVSSFIADTALKRADLREDIAYVFDKIDGKEGI